MKSAIRENKFQIIDQSNKQRGNKNKQNEFLLLTNICIVKDKNNQVASIRILI